MKKGIICLLVGTKCPGHRKGAGKGVLTYRNALKGGHLNIEGDHDGGENRGDYPC